MGSRSGGDHRGAYSCPRVHFLCRGELSKRGPCGYTGGHSMTVLILGSFLMRPGSLACLCRFLAHTLGGSVYWWGCHRWCSCWVSRGSTVAEGITLFFPGHFLPVPCKLVVSSRGRLEISSAMVGQWSERLCSLVQRWQLM